MTVNANGPNIKKIDEEEEGEKLENGLDEQTKKEVKIALPKKPVAQPFLALISGQVFGILTSGNLTDRAAAEQQLFTYVYIYVGVGVLVLLIHFMQFLCFYTVSCRLIAKIRHHYIKAILRQNAGWLDKHHCGVLTTQLNDNVERIREGVGDKMGLLIRGFAMFFAALILSFATEWRLALFMCPVAPMSCLCMGIMSREVSRDVTSNYFEKTVLDSEQGSKKVNRTVQKISEATSKELKDVGKAGAIAEEAVLGVRTVQALNGQEEMVDRFGGHLLEIGAVTDTGKVITVVISMMLGAYFLGVISPHLMVLMNARVSAAAIYHIIDRRPEIDVYSSEGKLPLNITGDIEFNDVHFRYPTRKDTKVLNGLNLKIRAGETVAFVGHSGCGKSTAVGLITRLYEAESGTVKIDEHDVRDVNLEWLRNTIGIVQQEPTLFNGTIEENLRVGSPAISNAEMIQVCKIANAHDFVMKLPQGYSTVIGEGAVQLSGGQKQRIAIARTLARNPRILLLDEATSALDANSESIVQQALDNASEGRTTIVIAHRLSTIRKADKIAVFEKGTIIELGTHEELIELGERYAELVRAQQFQPEADENLPPEEKPDSDRSSYIMSTGEQVTVTAESTAFEQAVQADMKHDGKITAGLGAVFANAKGQYCLMFLSLIVAICRGFEQPSMAFIYALVFGAIKYYDENIEMMLPSLVICLVAYICIGLGTFLFHFTASVLFGKVSEELTLTYRVKAFRNILYQDAAYFDNPQHAPGRLITRLARDAPNVKALSIEIIENVRTVQLLTRERYFYDKYEKSSKQQKRNEMEKGYYEAASFAVTQTFVYFSLASAYAVGIPLITRWNYDAQDVYRAVFSVLLSCLGVMNCSTFFPEFTKARAASGMMFNMINRRSKTGDINEGIKATLRGNLFFEDVHFSYPQRPHQPIMRGLQFTVQKGQTAAIVGPSGSGKSTVISLLERFYDATAGAVRYDGQDVRKLALGHVRTQVALVGQEPRLFAGTIKENICLGLKKVDDAQIREALEIANASKFLSNLPQVCYFIVCDSERCIRRLSFKGLDTEVGEKGTQLSGGQKQRIAIAR
ncbi:ABC transporter, ATP-binding protein [Ancylostoma duodenale]|uniref:ABC transporter, ATP-binding protein n=1 Tax=Ancylostoma duodenale TaxID=51022 RepID=A0A0C2H1K2_9BILA|nr:ABC transporter, ATP-binding protein [Ancylostoma duodenale]